MTPSLFAEMMMPSFEMAIELLEGVASTDALASKLASMTGVTRDVGVDV